MLFLFATFFQRSVYLKLLWNHFSGKITLSSQKIFGFMGADVVNLVNLVDLLSLSLYFIPFVFWFLFNFQRKSTPF